MKITKVRYERLRSFGNFQNETVGCEADVEGHEDPILCLAQLREWVNDQLGQREDDRAHAQKRFEIKELERQIRDRHEQVGCYRTAIAELQRALEEIGATESPAAQALLSAFNSFDARAPREMPF